MTQTRQEVRRQLEDASYTLCVVTGTRQLEGLSGYWTRLLRAMIV
ncbi:DUF5133 domain-containing protein [Streptomyces canus]